MVSFVDLTNRGKEMGIVEQRRDLHSIQSTRASGSGEVDGGDEVDDNVSKNATSPD
jgi:hypothetical protein